MYITSLRTAVVQCVVLFGLLHISCSELVDSGSVVRENQHAYLRHKRDVSCAKKYSEITDGHTACRSPTTSVTIGATGVSESEKDTILTLHNNARSQVDPPAKKMMKLSWDDEIANTAQRWAESCTISHDDNYKRYAFGRFSVGQNLAWGSHLTWSNAIQLWIDEKKDFTLGGSNSGTAVGHYTAMVWATTVKVGCGYALCGASHYYVCDYGPAGNLDINNPYVSGSSCSDCPNKCNNKLCDCGGKVCLNGGTMDPNTCQCTCGKSYLMQPDCGLNCTGIQEAGFCTRSFSKSQCPIYSNFPHDCPVMCDMCPYAGIAYNTATTTTPTPTTTVTTPSKTDQDTSSSATTTQPSTSDITTSVSTIRADTTSKMSITVTPITETTTTKKTTTTSASTSTSQQETSSETITTTKIPTTDITTSGKDVSRACRIDTSSINTIVAGILFIWMIIVYSN